MTPETLQAEYTKFERSYNQSTAATGPVKWQRLNEFRNGAFAALLQDVQQRVNAAKQQELQAERQRCSAGRTAGTAGKSALCQIYGLLI